MIGGVWRSVGRPFRRAAPPLLWYYAVTLAIPFANGAARAGDAFAAHALVVLTVPPILVALVCAIHTIARAAARDASR